MSENRLKSLEDRIDRVEQALLIDCDAKDAASTNLRQHLGATGFKTADQIKHKENPAPEKGSTKLPFDTSKIVWKTKEREDHTTWELANDDYNKDNPDYVALRKFLAGCGGKINSNGLFYWEMGTAVGRQPQKKNWRK